MCLQEISSRIYWMPGEECTDRPVLGYIRGEKYALQVDAGASPAHLAQFQQELKRRHLPSPSFTVLTHWHWDHTFGLCALDCPSIACAETRAMLETVLHWRWTPEAMAQRLQTGEEIPFCDEHIRVEYRDPQEIRVALPEIVFTEELTLELGGITARLLHLPAAHGEDNVIVLLPEERFAFLGDAPCGDFYHLDGGYDPALLSQMINWMETLPFDRCCTGHGQPENKASLLEELRQEQQAIFVQPAE